MCTFTYLQIVLLFLFKLNSIKTLEPKEIATFNDDFAQNRSLNIYLDAICSNLKANSEDIGLDPLKLPDLLETFSQSFWLIGEMVEVYNLTNGTLRNMETLHRYGDSLVTYANRTLGLELEMELDNLKIEYSLIASFNGHELQGKLYGDLKLLRIKLAATMEAKRWKVHLNDLSCPHPGSLSLSIETSRILGWLINSVLKIITTLFESAIVDEAQRAIRKAIEDYLKNFPTRPIQKI